MQEVSLRFLFEVQTCKKIPLVSSISKLIIAEMLQTQVGIQNAT